MKKIIIANWKANPVNYKKAVFLAKKIENGILRVKNTETVIAPPFCFLSGVGRLLKRSKLGAQNSFWESSGAHTGEVSPTMLRSLGVKFVIVGHSERRYGFFESDAIVLDKMKAVLSSNLKAVLCVGERERKNDNFQTVVRKQIYDDLRGVPKKFAKNVIIAYEPVWAIGSGKTVKPSDLYEMAVYIRRSVLDIFGQKIAHSIPVLYGGSVDLKNARSFLEVEGINGLLIGGASLKPGEFISVVKQAGQIN